MKKKKKKKTGKNCGLSSSLYFDRYMQKKWCITYFQPSKNHLENLLAAQGGPALPNTLKLSLLGDKQVNCSSVSVKVCVKLQFVMNHCYSQLENRIQNKNPILCERKYQGAAQVAGAICRLGSMVWDWELRDVRQSRDGVQNPSATSYSSTSYSS